MNRRRVLGLVVALLVAAGCNDHGDDSGASAPAPVSPPEVQPPPALAWTVQVDGGPMHVIQKMIALSATEVFALAHGLWKTEDGGQTWTKVWDGSASDIQFFDSMHGWMHTSDGLDSTSDGGVTWTRRLFFGIDYWNYNRSMSFVSPTTGWLANDNGRLYRTTDGVNWTSVKFSLANRQIKFIDAQSGWLVVNEKTGNRVMTTADGGETWQTRLEAPVSELFALSMDLAWVAGSGGMFRTTDGGATWTASEGDIPRRDLFFLDEKTGWAVDQGLWRTSNGGATWTLESPPLPTSVYSNITAACFADARTGWVAGMHGNTIYHLPYPIRGILFKATGVD